MCLLPTAGGGACPERCSCKNLRSLPESLHQLYKPRDGGEREEKIKSPLARWPMTNYHLFAPTRN